ncbi:MAG: glycosyltransferase family protein [Dongiaceae bacterium]
MTPRVLLYVQHLLGIGHLRRAAAIARGLAAGGFEVAFVSGGESVPSLDIGAARLVQLPAIRSGDSGFSSLVDKSGAPVTDALWRARQMMIMSELGDAAPDILVIEMFPFGRRQFRRELIPLLEAAAERRPRPLVACSVRDILVQKSKPERLQEMLDLLERHYDLVLVHGDPAFADFALTFPAAADIAGKIRYTGFVVGDLPARRAPSARRDVVLVSAGGGAVGAPLLYAALAARPLTQLRDAAWHVITGPNLAESDFAALQKGAGDKLRIERFRPDFPQLLASCRVSISQAGYNTLMEILAVGARAVVVPFADGQESEQPLRARLLAQRGLVQAVAPQNLMPELLAAAIDAAAAMPAPPEGIFNLAGAATTAEILHQALRQRRAA